jgi:anti-sigma-K factor RskA
LLIEVKGFGNIMAAITYRFSGNANQFDAVRALLLAVALTACIAVAVMLTIALVTALTPVVVGCCSAAVAAAPELGVMLALFAALGAMWWMKA